MNSKEENYREIWTMFQMTLVIAFLKARRYLSDYIANISAIDMIKDLLLAYVTIRYSTKLWNYFRGYGLIYGTQLAYLSLSKYFFKKALALPPLKSKVDAEVSTAISKMQNELMVTDSKIQNFNALPELGLSEAEVVDELAKLQKLKHTEWESGKVSGAVYHGGPDLISLQTKAFNMFCVANQLHPDVFPGVRKMEAEVVSMVLRLFNAPEHGCGSTTSGGSESLILAVLAAREYARKNRGVLEPEMIAPETIHAAVIKAASYFKIKLHLVPVDQVTYKVQIKKVKNLINSNTVLLLGSAPNFPHGIVDDIEALSALAVYYNIPLHVDCCLGSFTMALANKAGFEDVPIFDFRLPGVTSISCDTHKYGFAPKGSSTILYRSPKLRECQYFITDSWIGGLYGSPGLAGSKNGSVMAGCWATMVSLGEEGYLAKTRDIFSSARKLKEAIKKNHDLKVIGDPIGSVVSFTLADESKASMVYAIGDELNKKGWHLSTLQRPPALHLATTVLSVPVIDELIKDINECAAVVLAKGETLEGETAALYGVAGSVKTSGVADRLISGFLDTLYKTN